MSSTASFLEFTGFRVTLEGVHTTTCIDDAYYNLNLASNLVFYDDSGNDLLKGGYYDATNRNCDT